MGERTQAEPPSSSSSGERRRNHLKGTCAIPMDSKLNDWAATTDHVEIGTTNRANVAWSDDEG